MRELKARPPTSDVFGVKGPARLAVPGSCPTTSATWLPRACATSISSTVEAAAGPRDRQLRARVWSSPVTWTPDCFRPCGPETMVFAPKPGVRIPMSSAARREEGRDPVSVYRHISAETAHGFPVARMCPRLGVSASGYGDWGARVPSDRALSDGVADLEADGDLGREPQGYGAPRIHAELRRQPTCQPRLRPALPRRRHRRLFGLGWRLLRQRRR
jgi:hypothetical protein